ncbi:MAG: glycogen debranching N-terminal domain-containing protein [Gemmatimonadaceae bacterium]
MRPDDAVAATMAATAGAPEAGLEAVAMEEAVGYPTIACERETPIEGAVVLKHDRLFLLVDSHGDVEPAGHCSLGLFQDDTRILSHYALRVSGGPPVLLSAQVPRPYSAQIDLAVTDLSFGGNRWDPKHAIHVHRELLLEDALVERLTVTNYLLEPVDYWLELAVGCDFADIFEVRGWRREWRGEFVAPRAGEHSIAFAYRGRDGVLLRSGVFFRDAPDEIGPRGARWRFRLLPRTPVELEWAVRADVASIERPALVRAPVDDRRAELDAGYERWRAECSRWATDDEVFDATLARAIDDLRALYVEADGSEIISAGIPWYATAFGRDSIIASIQTLPLNPRIAVDTLRYLARRQGTREDPFTEEQPGKIMHELRRGELARSGEIPHVPYYGTIDATPLWLVLLNEAWRWTADEALVRELLPNARRALEWIDRYGDLDGDGFVEYARTSDKGLVNQGWKDSGDGVPFPDGRLPSPPIALVEVQGYVYDAKLRTAAILERFGDPDEAARLRADAERLRERIVERFWLEDVGCFALALDGDKRPLPTVTSNAGHLLWSRVPDAAHAARLAETLLGPDMFSGWGIRTLSARHPVFNPMSYHNGSIWPHDNALVVLGLSHYALASHALPVVGALHQAAANMELQRLPELYCGMRRSYETRPVLYPVSCSPQAWASGALFMLLQAMLGIFPEAPAGVLHLRNPVLPGFLRELTISRLRVGRSCVSLHFARHGTRTLVNLHQLDGEPLQVRIELD